MDNINTQTAITRSIVEQYYDFMRCKNIVGILQLVTDDIEWDTPGNEVLAPWTGVKIGKEGVKNHFDLQAKHITPLSFDVRQIFYDGDSAIAFGYLSTRIVKTDRVYNSHFITHFILQDDKIKRYLFSEDSRGLARLLASKPIESNKNIFTR